MIGKHRVIVESYKLKYDFEIKRNITVIQGESATGKTTLINLLQNYARRKERSGIRVQSDVPCIVFNDTGDYWQSALEPINESIVFFDEDYHFIFTVEFAKFIQQTNNYYVFITRKPLKNLPYSIQEIYGIRTSGKYHFPEKVYHEFYPVYEDISLPESFDKNPVLVLEDEGSGYQFYKKAFSQINCISAKGNTKIYTAVLNSDKNDKVIVIADGAAFGAYIDPVIKMRNEGMRLGVFLPESFEWLLLKAGVISDAQLSEILKQPENYIDSSIYFSWERFFTMLIVEKTKDDAMKSYTKESLKDYYLMESNVQKVLNILPKDLRDILINLRDNQKQDHL